MDRKEVANDTVTRDLVDLAKVTGNIYESTMIMAKRANQIAAAVKQELNQKLEEFSSFADTFEETFTLDRIKEPLFSILMPYLEDAKVLDLFSGTGNLAIEALSRGASFAWMNDINKRALRVISSNVSLTHTENCVKITGKEYEKCLKQVHNEGEKFDVIFLDPPYNANYEVKVLNLFAYTGGASVACLKAGASVVHVDSSRGMVDWCKENVKSSGMEDYPVSAVVYIKDVKITRVTQAIAVENDF